jgi:hypothetical protein
MLYSRMFFGGSSQFSPLAADSCLPDVSGRPRIAPSDSQRRSLRPKLPFCIDHPSPAALHRCDIRYNRRISVKLPEISTSTKSARNSRRICTSIFIGLKAAQNQHLQKTGPEGATAANVMDIRSFAALTKCRPGSASRLPAKVTNRMSFRRLIKSNLSEGSLRSFSLFVAAACTDLYRLIPTCPEFRGSFEGFSRELEGAFRPASLFPGCPTLGALCKERVRVCTFSLPRYAMCSKASRMNTCAKMVGGTPAQ